jgi:tol-pal system protein YbgF
MTRFAVLLACIALAGSAAAATRGAPVTSADGGELAARIDKLERQLSGQGLVNLLQQVQALQAEVGRLRGELEVQTHEVQQLRKAQRDLYNDLDQRLQRLEGGAVADPAAAGEAPAGAPPLENLAAAPPVPDTPPGRQGSELTVETVNTAPAATQAATGAAVAAGTAAGAVTGAGTGAAAALNAAPLPAVPQAAAQGVAQVAATAAGTVPQAAAAGTTAAGSDPFREQAEYQAAFKLLKDARYEEAIGAFNGFLAANPRSELADNARYWLGEAYYVTQDYPQALAAYEQLITTHPQSLKIADAMLKAAFSQQEMGQVDAARARLEEVRKRYPGSTAARFAEERLKKIGPAPAAASGRAAQ